MFTNSFPSNNNIQNSQPNKTNDIKFKYSLSILNPLKNHVKCR